MGFFSRLFGRADSQPTSKKSGDQALLMYLKLSDNELGETRERERIFKLEDALERAISRRRAGELDGDEFGGGFCTIFMYGPDANVLSEAVIATIRGWRPPAGSYLIKRYGELGSREQREDII